MFLSILPQPVNPADASRQVAVLTACKGGSDRSPASYFYGYWFSHWRA